MERTDRGLQALALDRMWASEMRPGRGCLWQWRSQGRAGPAAAAGSSLALTPSP